MNIRIAHSLTILPDQEAPDIYAPDLEAASVAIISRFPGIKSVDYLAAQPSDSLSCELHLSIDSEEFIPTDFMERWSAQLEDDDELDAMDAMLDFCDESDFYDRLASTVHGALQPNYAVWPHPAALHNPPPTVCDTSRRDSK